MALDYHREGGRIVVLWNGMKFDINVIIENLFPCDLATALSHEAKRLQLKLQQYGRYIIPIQGGHVHTAL